MRIGQKTIAAAVICGAMMCCSCSTYRQYSRPEMDNLSCDYFNVPQDTASIADLGWEDFFTDPYLRELIRTGLENNVNLQTAALRVNEAGAALDMARKAFLPGLNFAPNFGFSDSRERFSGSAVSYAVPFTASWEIDLGGKLLASRRKAEAGREAMELYERSVRTELVSGIAECYYSLLMLDAQLLVSETTSASWKENVRIMKAMKDAGMTNEASVSQTEANSCSIEASLYDLKFKITQMENALASLVGIDSREFARSSLRDISMPVVVPDGVPAFLLSRRPDVQAKEADLRQAFYDTEIARAAFYPSLTLNGEFGWEKALTSPAGWLLSLGANALQPIFSRGKLKGNLKIAEARQEETLIAFRQSLIDAGNEVNDALALCQSASGKTDVRKRQIEALESAVKSTEQLMRHSGATYLEVLTAQQSLLSARLLQISDRYDAIIGTVHLYKALGGGNNN